jgi:Lhr-like helicase
MITASFVSKQDQLDTDISDDIDLQEKQHHHYHDYNDNENNLKNDQIHDDDEITKETNQKNNTKKKLAKNKQSKDSNQNLKHHFSKFNNKRKKTDSSANSQSNSADVIKALVNFNQVNGLHTLLDRANLNQYLDAFTQQGLSFESFKYNL